MRYLIAGLLMVAGVCHAEPAPPEWCATWLKLAKENRDARNEVTKAQNDLGSIHTLLDVKKVQLERQKGLLDSGKTDGTPTPDHKSWIGYLERNEPALRRSREPGEEMCRIAFGEGKFSAPQEGSYVALWNKLQALDKDGKGDQNVLALQDKAAAAAKAEDAHIATKPGGIAELCPEQLAELNHEHVPVPGEDIVSIDNLANTNTNTATKPAGNGNGSTTPSGGGTSDEFRARLINIYLVSASAEDDIKAMQELYAKESRGGNAGSNTGNVVIEYQMKLFRGNEKRQIGDADPDGISKLAPGNATVRTATGVAIRENKWTKTSANAPQGAVLEVLEAPDEMGWVKVRYQGAEGYASGLWLAP